MTGIDYIQIVARNLQKARVSLTTAQVFLSVLSGNSICGDVISHTGLVPSVVSALLSSLVKGGMLEREGAVKPYRYKVTSRGVVLAQALLAKTI